MRTLGTRRDTFGNILKAYTKALNDDPLPGDWGQWATPPKPRKCVHVLHVVFELLWECQRQLKPEKYAELMDDADHMPGLGRSCVDIIRFAADSIGPDDGYRNVRTKRLLIIHQELEKHKLLSPMLLAKSRKAIEPTYVIPDDLVDPEDLRLDLPQKHGEDKRPWAEMPATNILVNYVYRNRRYNVMGMRSVAFPTRKVKRELQAKIQDIKDTINKGHTARAILKDDAIADKFRDKLGQIQYNVNGDTVGPTYYGFSRNFLQRLRKAEEAAKRKEYSREPSPVAPVIPPPPVRRAGFPGGFGPAHFTKGRGSYQPTTYEHNGRTSLTETEDSTGNSHHRYGQQTFDDGGFDSSRGFDNNGSANNTATGYSLAGGANYGGHRSRDYGSSRGGNISSAGNLTGDAVNSSYGHGRGGYNLGGGGYGAGRGTSRYGVDNGGYGNNPGGYVSPGGGFGGGPGASSYGTSPGGYDSTGGGINAGRGMNNSNINQGGYMQMARGFGGARGTNYPYGRR